MFFISFIGLLFVFPVTIYQCPDKQTTAFYLLLVSMLLYLIGVFGLTVFGNVPLNNRLAKFSLDSATAIAIAEMRRAFEKPWNTFHTIRTIAATASFSLGILSLLLRKS